MSAHIEKMKKEVNSAIDGLKNELVRIAREIHANPELGYQEYNSSRLLCEFLEKSGFDVEKNIAEMETAFSASYCKSPGGPVIALLAEYDALSGIGHGCGHNMIGTSAAGAAIGLSQLTDFQGTIIVVGCPAEEAGLDGAGGKVRLVESGFFDNIDAAMIFHPMPLTMVGGETTALIGLEFQFTGRAAHSAGNPWDGINALDGVLQTYNSINALRQHLWDDVRIHGIITQGGDAPNIVPEQAAARFFIRSQNNDYLNETVKKIKNCAKGAALATGAELNINKFNNFYAAMKSNTILAGIFKNNLEALGLKVEGKKKGKGSTDVGNVSRVIPACELSIRLGNGIVPHTREFLDAANSEAGYSVMMQGAKVLAMSFIDLSESPELMEKAKSEFQKV